MKKYRDDISRFLVHLTKDTNAVDAIDNLINIFAEGKIRAVNPHCLFKYELKDFSTKLKNKFNTVCLTETPLNQIKKIIYDIPNRQVKLKPYGIIFWKDDLFNMGASPAIYINGIGTHINDFLLEQFRNTFKDIKSHKELVKEVARDEEMVQYYSLINVVNKKHDFMWEREWRYNGNLEFTPEDIVAIIAENPKLFIDKCKQELPQILSKKICRIPIINPEWDYEELLEKLALDFWKLK